MKYGKQVVCAQYCGLDQLHYSYVHYKKAIVTARDVSPWDESGNSLGCYLMFKVGMKYGKQVVGAQYCGLDQLCYSCVHCKKAIVIAWDESVNNLVCSLKQNKDMKYGKQVVFSKTNQVSLGYDRIKVNICS